MKTDLIPVSRAGFGTSGCKVFDQHSTKIDGVYVVADGEFTKDDTRTFTSYKEAVAFLINADFPKFKFVCHGKIAQRSVVYWISGLAAEYMGNMETDNDRFLALKMLMKMDENQVLIHRDRRTAS